jgi:hypothetical protein
MLWFEYKKFPQILIVQSCSPAVGSIWGGSENFNRWGLAGGRRSLDISLRAVSCLKQIDNSILKLF